MRDGQTGGACDTGSQGRESREQAGLALPLPREHFPDLPLTVQPLERGSQVRVGGASPLCPESTHFCGDSLIHPPARISSPWDRGLSSPCSSLVITIADFCGGLTKDTW